MATNTAENQIGLRHELVGFVVAQEQNVKAIAALSAAAIGSYMAEDSGLHKDFGEPVRAVSDSMAHPLLGFTAAFGVATFANVKKRYELTKTKIFAASIGATLALDAAAETAQSARTGFSYNPVSPENSFETTKDLAFAGLGLGLFYLRNRRRNKTTS